jgi:hypothetical protein
LSGELAGRIGENRFEGQIGAPNFNAGIWLTSNGRGQGVTIRPSGGDIADARIELRRQG